MNEYSFIRSIHHKLPSDIFKWKIHDSFAAGVPDALYAKNSILFVEYKYIKKIPVKPTTLIKTSISPMQVSWLDNMKCAAHSALIIGSPNNIYIKLDNFSEKITKEMFMEKKVTILDVVGFIVNKTYLPKKVITAD